MNSSGAAWILALALSLAAHWGLLASLTGAAVAPSQSPPAELVIEDQPALAPTLKAGVVSEAGALSPSVAPPTAVQAVAPSAPETHPVEHSVVAVTNPQEAARPPEPDVAHQSADTGAAPSPPTPSLDESAPADLAPSTPDVARDRVTPQNMAAASEPAPIGPAETSQISEQAQGHSAEPAEAHSAHDADAPRVRAKPSMSQTMAASSEEEFAGPAGESSIAERAQSATAEAAPASSLMDTRSGIDILPAEDAKAARAGADGEPTRIAPSLGSKTAREAEDGGPRQAVSSSLTGPVTDTSQTAHPEDARRIEPATDTGDKVIAGVAGGGQVKPSTPYKTVSPSGAAAAIAPVTGRPGVTAPRQLTVQEEAIRAAPVAQAPIAEERVALAPPQPPMVLESKEAEPEAPALEMASYIREYDGGPCFFALPVALDEKRPEIEGFATSANLVRSFGRSFRDTFHIEPKLDVREVTDIQCHAISFIHRVLKSPTPEITISLDRDTIPGGASLNGTVEGVRQGFVILLFVDDEGKVHDVTEYLRRTETGYTFSAPVTPTGEGAMRDQLIVAIAADRKLGFVRTEVPIPNSAYFSSILKQVVASGADVSIGLSAFRVSPLNLE